MTSDVDARVYQISHEYGVRIIDKQRYPELGETRALATLDRILKHYGEDHFRMVLSTLAETENNKACLDETAWWCVSDLIRAFPDLVEKRPSEWLECWDKMPVGELMFVNQNLSGVVKLRHSLAGMLAERIIKRMGPGAGQLDFFDDRKRP
ncbi:hypothetical protein IFT84_17545 [Rhizobium sp. CFBP 8762]|uniref:hypothetical protein n=1 Tax=Rhizobium sp. CFBP 8762 TaxID=2775279 RepID=UPI00177EEC7E|nr:hypothetical protein [Rhizobium sp. CFBP 8762]MBD8556315.1 hypothetical protein [Rhizobium sp. CFBP 8762]